MAKKSFKEILEEKNNQFQDTPYPFGMTGLTSIGYMSSRRGTMFTAHLNQFKSPINPEFPRCFTNMENTVGKYSSGYKRLKNDVEVVAKIYKFDDSVPEVYNNYIMVFYEPDKNHYFLETRNSVKKLTEKFGFRYNNKYIDSCNVGDKIEKDTVIYKSNSYDDDMNYGYGMNLTTMHTLDPYLSEDAILISETASKRFSTISVGTPETVINDNDRMINLYGDKENYKCFPDIGEDVRDNIILAKKRIHNDRILYDMKASELKKVSFLNNKILYANGKVIDIDIYSNKDIDEYPDDMFHTQLKKYLKMQKNFYMQLYEVLKNIINNTIGATYSRDVSYWYDRASKYINPDYIFRNPDGNIFNCFKIKFTVEKVDYITTGQKLVGRCGNKGVVSKVLPDDQMPVLSNGVRVDILLNSLSPTNRLISVPLYELSITFLTDRLAEHMKTLPSHKEREKIFFAVMNILVDREAEKLEEYYKGLNKAGKDEFYQSIYDNGIYVEIPVLWEKKPLWDRIEECYDKYPDIFVPYDVYIKKHGVYHKMMGKYTGYVGQMYYLALKQTSLKEFSSRSTAAINNKELPVKSDSAKKHQDLYAKTPIKFGYQEILNLLTVVRTRTMAEINLLYRSSVSGRRHLGKLLLTEKKTINKIRNMERFVNRNVEILNVNLKPMGVKLEFHDEMMYIDSNIKSMDLYETKKGKLYLGDTEGFYKEAIKERLEESYTKELIIESTKDRKDRMDKDMAKMLKKIRKKED